MVKKGEIGAKKATVQEAIDRTNFARKLLCRPMDKGDIKRAVTRNYSISSKMAEVYIGRAREVLVKETGRDKSEHRTDAYAVLKGIITSMAEKTPDRLKAQEQMSKLLGLNNPDTVAITDTQGNDIATDGARAVFNRIAARLNDAPGSGRTPSSNGSNGSANASGAAP